MSELEFDRLLDAVNMAVTTAPQDTMATQLTFDGPWSPQTTTKWHGHLFPFRMAGTPPDDQATSAGSLAKTVCALHFSVLRMLVWSDQTDCGMVGLLHWPPRRPTTGPSMTTLLNKTIRRAGLIAAFAVSFSAFSTSSFAFGSEARQMCMSDAFRLCSAEIPDIPRITACMVRQRRSLSPGCRAVLDRELATRQ